jgi:hypothetical protein
LQDANLHLALSLFSLRASSLPASPPPSRAYSVAAPHIERLLSDDPEALALLREATTEGKGGANNPDGLGGKSGKSIVNGNNVTIDNQPDLFTEPTPKPDAPQRGNRRSYTLSRLKRESPALFAEVTAGNHLGRRYGARRDGEHGGGFGLGCFILQICRIR